MRSLAPRTDRARLARRVAIQDDIPARGASGLDHGPTSARRVRVVLVEDLEPLRRLIVSALAYEGIDVRGVGTVAEGIAAVSAGELDVLVTDQQLPDGTGHELVKRARLVRPALKVICVSGSPQDGRAFDRVLEKPFDVSHLAAEIRALAAHD